MKKYMYLFLMITLIFIASYNQHNYIRKNCEVLEVENNIVKIIDKCGYVWTVEDDTLKAGDVVNLKMHDKKTSEYIQDDIIKKVVKINI